MNEKITIPSQGENLVGKLFTANSDNAVVMAQGTGALAGMWEEKAQKFADNGINVITADYRGFGESTGQPREDLNFIKHREDIREMINFASNNFKNVNALGHSYGGSHVMANAENVKDKIILEMPYVNVFSYLTKNPITALKLFPKAILDLIAGNNPVYSKLTGKNGVLPDENSDSFNQLADKYKLEFWNNRIASRELVRCMFNMPNQKPLKEKDVMIINTENDQTLSSYITNRLSKKIGANQLKKEGNHFMNYDDEEINNAEINFLKKDNNQDFDVRRIIRGGSLF